MPRIRPIKKIFFLLFFICGLSFSSMTLSSQAQALAQQLDGAKNKEIINDLTSQLALLKWGAGCIITALCGAIGLLYKTVMDTHAKMITLLEKESETRLNIIEKVSSNFSNVSNNLDEFSTKISEVNRRLDSIYLERRDHTKP